ncbi:AraC family transcriptional regulator [Ruegeria sp. HKCCD8929]|uniref:AraC family transcriptional regulator n=1 Tax=Ruegeria sp. HKCCD8929 TaxID=2683006 RepID=UPI001487A1DC|nr:AraC family transcriptional regulator [Ruegeria sp. HKCCD8929]
MAAVERAFDKADLPIDVVEDRSLRIPMSAMVKVFSEAERLSGDPQFGLRVGLEMKGTDLGAWFEYATQAPSLRLGIQRLAWAITLFQNGPSITLTDMRDGAIWRYHVPRESGAAFSSHSDHDIPPMLDFARNYLGADWSPRWIGLDYPDLGHGQILRDLLQAEPLYGRSALSIPLTASDLETPRPMDNGGHAYCSADLQARVLSGSSEFLIAVEACILLGILENAPELGSVARRMNMSTRSLQRRLMLDGYTFREVLSKVRYRRALSLLRETGLGVTDIAHGLGYSDVANFSRAFKSWAGRPRSSFTR